MTVRLTKNDWLDHGLKVLSASGAGALKADPLARSLRVSRGSFYWHFRDTADFHAALLNRWHERTTGWVTRDLEQGAGDPRKFRDLMRMAFSADDRLERAIRSWAVQNRAMAKAVASVDEARIDYLKVMLQSAGVSHDAAPGRAAFFYWAYLGRIMSGGALPVDDVDAMARLLIA